jgi:hypothetical protein
MLKTARKSLMSTLSLAHSMPQTDSSCPARSLYFDLFKGQIDEQLRDDAAVFLTRQLAEAASLPTDLPDDQNELLAWMHTGVEHVGRQYGEYLQERENGGARRYFRNKSHALHFIRSVAPTKMVDGAWLYGLLSHWRDARFLSLLQTYVEELGEGLPSKNHVVLYQKLLASQGCERWNDLSDENYVQGALQLALAYNADHFLPEVIGFNLGYEQLPLHLLICAYELKELGIDPYYFTLHITVDNADSGHARKAVDAISSTMPRAGDAAQWYRRVRQGYNLNSLGANTNSVIESFSLDREMRAIFASKGVVGQYAHSNYRQVAGRSVNDWLSQPQQTTDLIAAMEESGWFKRHQDPQNSRFWKLIQSENAKMFGVFSAYEQQVIYDWIVGDATGAESWKRVSDGSQRRHLSPEARHNLLHAQSVIEGLQDGNSDFDEEVRALESRLASGTNVEETVCYLIEMMSPAQHHTPSGLGATRLFNELLM